MLFTSTYELVPDKNHQPFEHDGTDSAYGSLDNSSENVNSKLNQIQSDSDRNQPQGYPDSAYGSLASSCHSAYSTLSSFPFSQEPAASPSLSHIQSDEQYATTTTQISRNNDCNIQIQALVENSLSNYEGQADISSTSVKTISEEETQKITPKFYNEIETTVVNSCEDVPNIDETFPTEEISNDMESQGKEEENEDEPSFDGEFNNDEMEHLMVSIGHDNLDEICKTSSWNDSGFYIESQAIDNTFFEKINELEKLEVIEKSVTSGKQSQILGNLEAIKLEERKEQLDGRWSGRNLIKMRERRRREKSIRFNERQKMESIMEGRGEQMNLAFHAQNCESHRKRTSDLDKEPTIKRHNAGASSGIQLRLTNNELQLEMSMVQRGYTGNRINESYRDNPKNIDTLYEKSSKEETATGTRGRGKPPGLDPDLRIKNAKIKMKNIAQDTTLSDEEKKIMNAEQHREIKRAKDAKKKRDAKDRERKIIKEGYNIRKALNIPIKIQKPPEGLTALQRHKYKERARLAECLPFVQNNPLRLPPEINPSPVHVPVVNPVIPVVPQTYCTMLSPISGLPSYLEYNMQHHSMMDRKILNGIRILSENMEIDKNYQTELRKLLDQRSLVTNTNGDYILFDNISNILDDKFDLTSNIWQRKANYKLKQNTAYLLLKFTENNINFPGNYINLFDKRWRNLIIITHTWEIMKLEKGIWKQKMEDNKWVEMKTMPESCSDIQYMLMVHAAYYTKCSVPNT